MTLTPEPEGQRSPSDTSGQEADPRNAGLFSRFARLCEEIDSTQRKVEKSRLISDYLSELHSSELVIATRCLSGYIFPLREQRTLNVSSLIILNCFAACAGVPTSFVREQYAKHEDIGNLAFELFSGGLPIVIAETLTISNVMSVLSELSSISGTKRKGEHVIRLLRKASPLEAKYLVRLMHGDLQIGVLESDVEDAISQWRNVSIGRIQSANLLTGDIGETALLCCQNKIDDARMRLYSPTNFMHAAEMSIRDDIARIFPDRFVVEDKFDGIRAQVHVGLDFPGKDITMGSAHDGLRVVIFSDELDDITERFTDLVPSLSGLLSDQAGTVDAVGVILDGVIVPTRNGEVRPFAELQKRLNSAEPRDASRDTTVGFVSFDLLFSEGRSLIQEDWYTRAEMLNKTTFDAVATFRARSHFVTTNKEIETILEMALLRGSQGVVVKNPRSTYKPARKGSDWIKIFGPSEFKSD